MESLVRQKLVHEWQRRVDAEYCSAAIVSDFLHELIVLGISPDLIIQGANIIKDEVTHAALSYEVASSLSDGAIKNVTIPKEKLRFSQKSHRGLEEIFDFCISFFCCGETVAVPLFEEMLLEASQPKVKRTLTSIIKDEKKHSDFGWNLLEELLNLQHDLLKKRLKSRLPIYCNQIRAKYSSGPSSHSLTREEKSWGLMAPATYSKIVERTVTSTIHPKLEGYCQ